MSDHRSLEEMMRLLPWQTRLSLRLKWCWIGVYSRIPVGRAVSLILWKARKGGWLGVFDPPFNITKQDRNVFDKRLRWHEWGVLSDGDGFRAYTPTSHSVERFSTTEAAWNSLGAVYWGKHNKSDWTRRPNGVVGVDGG